MRFDQPADCRPEREIRELRGIGFGAVLPSQVEKRQTGGRQIERRFPEGPPFSPVVNDAETGRTAAPGSDNPHASDEGWVGWLKGSGIQHGDERTQHAVLYSMLPPHPKSDANGENQAAQDR